MDDARFYDAAWEQWDDMIRYSPAPRLRREKILSWLAPLRPATLLDVGCGNGEFLSQAAVRLPGTALSGADISPSVIEKNRARFPALSFSELDLDRAALPGRYEAVVCMEVVEHCADHQAALAHLAEMTAGRLFVTVPCGPVFPIDKNVGHVRHFEPADIAGPLERAGLRVQRAMKWGFPFFNLYKHAINVRPESMSQAFLSSKRYSAGQKFLSQAVYAAFRLSLPWFGYQLFVTARR